MPKKNKKKYTAEELIERLRYKYDGNAYVVLEQVADGTGAYCQSWVDAVVIGLWPSKGLTRAAFEIKVSRGDFIREIQNPNKNAWAKKCFHEFWYVTPKEVVKTVDEIPKGCGWMQPFGKTLKIVKAATRMNPTLDDSLLASLVRSLQDEKNVFVRDIKENVLEKSKEHQNALACQRVVERFLHERDEYYYSNDTEEETFKKLVKATTGKKVQKERRQVLDFLSRFQNNIYELFKTFAVLAHVSLLERDEMGEFIVSKWGGNDEALIERIKQKPRKTGKKRRDEKLMIYEFLSECAKMAIKELPGSTKKTRKRRSLLSLIGGNKGENHDM